MFRRNLHHFGDDDKSGFNREEFFQRFANHAYESIPKPTTDVNGMEFDRLNFIQALLHRPCVCTFNTDLFIPDNGDWEFRFIVNLALKVFETNYLAPVRAQPNDALSTTFQVSL